MPKRATEAPPWVSLDASSGVPLHRQPYEGMRAGTLSGWLPAGTRLPSTRIDLATSCGGINHHENLLAPAPGIGQHP